MDGLTCEIVSTLSKWPLYSKDDDISNPLLRLDQKIFMNEISA